MRFLIAFAATVLIAVVIFYSPTEKKKFSPIDVDLIVHNGIIYTVDSSFSITEAFAVKNGLFVETGTNNYILSKYTSTKKIDAQGNAVFPGFIDSHCHFLNYGLGLNQVDLTGTKSFDEVINRVVAFNSPDKDLNQTTITKNKSDNWIIGRGWDQNDWERNEYPNRKILDSIFPNTPVLLKRIDGHAALANSEALKRAGINTFKKIDGGEMLLYNTASNQSNKSSFENITGILIDNAVDLVSSKIPLPEFNKIKNALLNAQKNCFAVGLTTVDDAGLMKNEIDCIDTLQKVGLLKMRIYAMLSDSAPNYTYYLDKGTYKTERLNVRSFKFYADGALGSRGACLLENYSDKKNWKGFLLKQPHYFDSLAKKMFMHGFQMNTHCIGDSAVKYISSIYTKYLIENSQSSKRWRIEHYQVADETAIDMLKQHFIIPSVQPTHATSDMPWAEDRIGKNRLKGAYAYQTLLKYAGMLALGTDFPVEDISPFKTFYASVFRKDALGIPNGGFTISEALTREETLKGMTIWGAFANFEEKEKGSIETGKFADFIILDTDLMTCPENKILRTKVLYTFINGEIVYQLK